MSYKTLMFLILMAGAAHADDIDPVKDDLTIEGITEIMLDLEYQVSDQAKQAKHANDFLRQVYKDINND